MIELLEESKIRLYQIDVNNVKCNDNALYNKLTQAEQQRADKFVFEKDRHRYIVAHGALQKLLSSYFGKKSGTCELLYTTHGKPHFPNEKGIEFNISYSKDLVLIGFAGNCMLGIDIEYLERDIDIKGVAAHVFNSREQALLQDVSGQERVILFYKIWTGKEALMKSVGIGLGAFNGEDNVNHYKNIVSDFSIHHYQPNEKYLAAVATDKKNMTNEIYDMKELENFPVDDFMK